jgi:putative transposase
MHSFCALRGVGNGISDDCLSSAKETLRADCLDWLLILGPQHLDRVLRGYLAHYNQRRPHRGLQLWAPESAAPVEEVDSVPDIQRRDLLGGLIHEYESAA